MHYIPRKMSFFNNHNVCVIYKITCFAVIFKKMHQVTVNKSLIQVKMVLYKQGKEKAVLRFNAANSTNINWFSEANVLESPWKISWLRPRTTSLLKDHLGILAAEISILIMLTVPVPPILVGFPLEIIMDAIGKRDSHLA